jgi:hypothetical protein
MKSIKSLLAISAVALATAAVPIARAGVGDVYSSTFQGVTFTFTQTDADTLTFELAGTVPLAPNWNTAQYLAAFDLKDLGLNFGNTGQNSGQTGTAFGPGTPGWVDSGTIGTGLLGLNAQLSASSVDCQSAGTPPGGICFDVAPDVALGSGAFDFLYTINFSSPLNIGNSTTGLNTLHLQIAFSNVQDGPKVGSLYSADIGTSGTSTSTSGISSTGVPEPSSSGLALLGLGLVGASFWGRRKKA